MDVANSPDALDTFGVPLLQFEEAVVIRAQNSASDLVDSVRGYSNRFPEDRAGVWIEGPLVVVAFSDNIPAHRLDVAALFGNKVVVREVRYSIRELQAFVHTVSSEKAWIESVVHHLLQIDFEEHLNAVEISYIGDREMVEAAVTAHFGNPDWLVLRWDGPGPWHGPIGDLRVRVVDRDGEPVGILCLVGSSDPRVQDERFSAFRDGRCFYDNLPAVQWSVRVEPIDAADPKPVFRTYDVPADGVIRDTVVVDW